MLRLVNPLHSLNAYSPMVVTELGILMLVKPLKENAPVPMEMTEVGMSMLVRPLQPENACLSIDVTE
jgi:hypothetical protein